MSKYIIKMLDGGEESYFVNSIQHGTRKLFYSEDQRQAKRFDTRQEAEDCLDYEVWPIHSCAAEIMEVPE